MSTYGPNVATGGYASAKSEYYPAADAFNGTTAEDGWVGSEGYGVTTWLQYQFTVTRKIAKLKVWAGVTSWNNIPNPIHLLASDTGVFGGEEVELLDTGSLSWTTNEAKSFEFTNTTAYLYYRLSGPAGGGYPRIGEVEMYELAYEEGESSADLGVDASPDAFSLTDSVPGDFGVSAAAVGTLEFEADSSDVFGVSAIPNASQELQAPVGAQGFGVGAVTEAFNLTRLLDTYRLTITKRYYLTLTGTADSLPDLILPISSFQFSRRSSTRSRLSAVVPNMDYASGIATRPNGEMILYMALIAGSTEVLREEVLRVTLETARIDKGSRNQSVSISGTADSVLGGNVFTVTGASYQEQDASNVTVRLGVDAYVRPGDVVKLPDGTIFTADAVSGYASAAYESMEISGMVTG